jgi:predicted metal-dependent hydrolase
MNESRQLDLFIDAPPPEPTTPRPPARREPRASRGDATVPTVRPQSLASGTRWREVRASTQSIGFVLKRSRRKSIGLTINDDGLLVTAPNWVTLAQIDEVVTEKSNWILDKLSAWYDRRAQLAMADTHWQDGGSVPYMGRRIVLRLGDTLGRTRLLGAEFEPRDGDVLSLALPRDADHARIRDAAHAWLQQQARTWFEQRLLHFLSAQGLQLRRWRLSSAATRWGSCNSDGNIMLNWRLIHFERDIIDYVVAHEIAHLREMNHSKDFWREVGRILPGFERARDALRQHDPATLPLI